MGRWRPPGSQQLCTHSLELFAASCCQCLACECLNITASWRLKFRVLGTGQNSTSEWHPLHSWCKATAATGPCTHLMGGSYRGQGSSGLQSFEHKHSNLPVWCSLWCLLLRSLASAPITATPQQESRRQTRSSRWDRRRCDGWRSCRVGSRTDTSQPAVRSHNAQEQTHPAVQIKP